VKISTTLDDILKKQSGTSEKNNAPDTYEEYVRKNGLYNTRGYANAAANLYASTRRDLSSYGINNRKINNKGLQNSGYAAYIDDLAEEKLASGLASIRNNYDNLKSEAAGEYRGYLESYMKNQESIKNKVLTHLTRADAIDLNTAIAYGISAGLTRENAEAVGKAAYESTRSKVFNSILSDVVSLGLDSEGARMLAIKRGVSEADADAFAAEIKEMLDHYGTLSEEYLEYLETRNNQ
jgi:hypothetical protein